jgi:hypothetical protein
MTTLGKKVFQPEAFKTALEAGEVTGFNASSMRAQNG